MEIGFIGLGAMGLPIASNLLTAGHKLRVFNRTASKAEPLVKNGAQVMSSPAAVASPGGSWSRCCPMMPRSRASYLGRIASRIASRPAASTSR